MTFEEIVKKLKKINQVLLERHPEISENRDMQILARSAKVSEEYGELIDEVLSSLKLQRSDKVDAYDKNNLRKEFGDVFNSLLLLGVALDIDVKQAIEDRVEEMYHRYGIKE